MAQGQQCRVLLLGKTGTGKSSLGNLLTGNSGSFPVSSGMISSASEDCEVGDGAGFVVVDTADVTHGQIVNPAAVSKLLKQAFERIGGEFDAVLLVTRLDVRFTEEERGVLRALTQGLGRVDFGRWCTVVFTHGDCIGNDGHKFKEEIDSLKSQVPFLDELIKQCGNHVAFVDMSRGCPSELMARQRDSLRQVINMRTRDLEPLRLSAPSELTTAASNRKKSRVRKSAPAGKD